MIISLVPSQCIWSLFTIAFCMVHMHDQYPTLLAQLDFTPFLMTDMTSNKIGTTKVSINPHVLHWNPAFFTLSHITMICTSDAALRLQ